MAVDIAPELYERIQRRFQEKYDKSMLYGSPISDMRKKLDAGEATFQDADMYAVQVGSMLSDSMLEVLQLEEMPNQTLYYNIAQRTIGTSLQDTYGLVSSVAAEVQEEMNLANGIGLKAVKPEANLERIGGLVEKASEATDQSTLSSILKGTVENLVMSAVDDTVKDNAKYQSDAGMQTKVIRIYDGKGLHDGKDSCQFCLSRQGTYTYPEAVKHDVFRRHVGCGCIIDYQSYKTRTRLSAGQGKGWKEDVLSRQEAEELEKRILEQQQTNKPDMSGLLALINGVK